MDFEPKDKSILFDGPDKIQPGLLETFPYKYPHRGADLIIETEEFTHVCPYSGLPDYARLRLHYIPREVCVELRSLKYYLLSYRTVGIWYEHAINHLLEDLVRVLEPERLEVELTYNVRGGLRSIARATFDRQRGDVVPPPTPLTPDGMKSSA